MGVPEKVFDRFEVLGVIPTPNFPPVWCFEVLQGALATPEAGLDGRKAGAGQAYMVPRPLRGVFLITRAEWGDCFASAVDPLLPGANFPAHLDIGWQGVAAQPFLRPRFLSHCPTSG